MKKKILTCLILIIFLFVSSSCSHTPKKDVPPSPRDEMSSAKADEPWWKKDENQFFLAVLIILGIGIATSASMIIIYNSGGLFIGIYK